jgi:hypothetical protein
MRFAQNKDSQKNTFENVDSSPKYLPSAALSLFMPETIYAFWPDQSDPNAKVTPYPRFMI